MTRREALRIMAGAAVGCAGCAREPSGRKVVKFWGLGREGEVAARLFEGFTQERPDIVVDVQQLPFTSAHEKLLTAFAGETLPDICQLGNTWVPEFEALGALEPLDAYVPAARDFDANDYFEGFLDANRLDGVLYGAPWYVDTRLLFYRRDILHQAGFDAPATTWREWEAQLAAIKALVGPERYSVLLPLNEFEPLLVFALQQPEPLLKDDAEWSNFGSDDFRRALEFYKSLFDRELAPRASNTQISNVWDEFGRGYFSFYISGPWNIAEFRRRMPRRLENAWMTAPMPGPDGPGVSMAGGSSLVIFRGSERKAESWALIEYLSRPATQQRFYELTGDMPPRRTSWELPALARSPWARAFRQQLDRVRSPPKAPEWERIATEMRLMSERVVLGVQTIEQGIADLDRRVNQILEKRRWMLARRKRAADGE
jgi:multiple sugar transport system substrate-binding protein